MVAKTDIVVEVAGPQNENLWFLPLDRRIRGRFDAAKLPEPSGALMRRFPQPIPGQRIGLNVGARTGFVDEPLRDPEHAAVRKECEKAGAIPERQEFSDIDVATWVHHLKGGVAAGKAHLVQGELPEKVEGVPKLSLVSTPPKDPIDKLVSALERQNELLAKLLAQRA